MNTLMGVNKLQGNGGSLPLYMSVIERILRELREKQQETGLPFNYRTFKEEVKKAALTDAQLGPLQQRLETLESFMVERQAKALNIFVKGKKGKGFRAKEEKVKKGPVRGNDWTPKVYGHLCPLCPFTILGSFFVTQCIANCHLARPVDNCRPVVPLRHRRDGLFTFQHLPLPLPREEEQHRPLRSPRRGAPVHDRQRRVSQSD